MRARVSGVVKNTHHAHLEDGGALAIASRSGYGGTVPHASRLGVVQQLMSRIQLQSAAECWVSNVVMCRPWHHYPKTPTAAMTEFGAAPPCAHADERVRLRFPIMITVKNSTVTPCRLYGDGHVL